MVYIAERSHDRARVQILASLDGRQGQRLEFYDGQSLGLAEPADRLLAEVTAPDLPVVPYLDQNAPHQARHRSLVQEDADHNAFDP